MTHDSPLFLQWAQRRSPQTRNVSRHCTFRSEGQPFAEGAFQLVYKDKYLEGPQKGEPCVTKVFKAGEVFDQRYFNEDIRIIGRAKEIVTAFDEAALVYKGVFVNEAAVWYKLQPNAVGRYELCLVEPMIEGGYVKFNSNSGHATAGYDLIQALSHSSFDYSGGQEVLCDLQGGRYYTCYVITDPVILSRSGKYGPADLGPKGISNFFFNHKCSKFCRPHWREESVPMRHFHAVPGTTMELARGYSQRTQPQVPGGELTLIVRQLELGDADAPLARMRVRVTKAYDSMMVRLERFHTAQGRAPLRNAEQEVRKIDLLALRTLGRLNGLAHTLRQWSNQAKHQRDQWQNPPTDRAVQHLVKEVIAELERLGW